MRIAIPALRSRRRRVAASIVVLAMALAAVIGLLTLSGSTRRPVAVPPVPQSSSSVVPVTTGSTSAPPSSVRPSKRATPAKAALTPFRCSATHATQSVSTPVRICVPALRVDASVMTLGLNSDRTVQVPPLSRVGDAGWYKYSAPPGEVGPTVILGHVDSAEYGDGVFYRLGQLTAGDKVLIGRDDGRTATFRIDRVQEVAKSRFPSLAVYGATSGPAIRLVTCGGRFDASTGNYVDNIIAYGSLLHISR